MAQDQATAILVVGTLWVTYKVFEQIRSDFPFIKHLGYWFCSLIAWVGLNIADSIAEIAYDQFVHPLLTAYTWFLSVYGALIFVLYWKDMLLMAKSSFDNIKNKIRA